MVRTPDPAAVFVSVLGVGLLGYIAVDGTAPLAAWLLLQSRWLGDRQLTVIVRDDDERLLRVTYDGGSNWRQWIDRVDAALAVASRTSPPAPGADSTGGAAQLVLIAPARHRLAGQRGIELRELASERFILREDRIFLKNVSLPHAPVVKP